MAKPARLWMFGALTVTVNVACIVFNLAFALSFNIRSSLSVVHALLYVAFAFNLLATIGAGYFSTFYVRHAERRRRGSQRLPWSLFGTGVLIALLALILSGVCLIWILLKRKELPLKVISLPPMTLLGVWLGLWGLSLILQAMLFTVLGIWSKSVLRSQPASRIDLDFGVHMPQMEETRPASRATHRSFQSQDLTLHTPPRTPTSPHGSSTRRSSSTRVGAGSLKGKFPRSSSKSSLDLQAFPASEAMSIDSAFDQWDTSSVHREMRATIHSSPPVTRSGLETIPGSRPESPADALDGPFLPSSPHATSSETATALGWSPSSPSTKLPTSSPPSSPPNFSRPTSSSINKAPAMGFEISMQDLIHPLFRPNSPRPPPIAVAGTMVTASPMAEQLITPKTLARLRSNSQSQQWKTMPSIPKHERPVTPGSRPGSPRSEGFPSPGSPGPSIVEEEEEDLPPILPGFVLSAGSRSSLVGYGKRKSVKNRPRSQLSIGSRLSSLLT